MFEYDQNYQLGSYEALIEMFIERSTAVLDDYSHVDRRRLQLLIEQAQETLQKYENNG